VSTLEITTTKKVDVLSKNMFLKSESFNGDSIDYLLISSEVKNLKAILIEAKALDSNIVYRLSVG
tara:strand:+ start:950 stop:1144 length:195 start_codon:yes stop_codon:yes gene_type:complete